MLAQSVVGGGVASYILGDSNDDDYSESPMHQVSKHLNSILKISEIFHSLKYLKYFVSTKNLSLMLQISSKSGHTYFIYSYKNDNFSTVMFDYLPFNI